MLPVARLIKHFQSFFPSGTVKKRLVDNKKDIVVIWPDFDPKAKSVTLFITGLSNETVVIKLPRSKKTTDETQRRIYLRKTLELKYHLAGDPAFRTKIKPKYKAKRWVMR